MVYANIDEFIKNDKKRRNEWIYEPGIQLYMRHSMRLFDGKLHKCIDIANVIADTRGQGTFTAVANYLECLPINLYVENVLEQRFADWFFRRGYKPIYYSNSPDLPISFVRLAEKAAGRI